MSALYRPRQTVIDRRNGWMGDITLVLPRTGAADDPTVYRVHGIDGSTRTLHERDTRPATEDETAVWIAPADALPPR